MAGEVDVSNLAVMICGKHSNIIDLNEGTPEANYCKNAINQARRDVLRSYDWNFAKSSRALTLSSFDPPIDWRYRYQYPKDALAIRTLIGVRRNNNERPWSVEIDDNSQRSILCDVEGAQFRFTKDIQQIDLFDPAAANALATRLAWYISTPLGLSRSDKASLLQQYQQLMAVAAADDANEAGADQRQAAPWLEARNL